ncbi:hypothetical protein [Lyngbya sp. PCC 8106]|uniref:hypothetical protein n=1 Tax=Lyngbya sp. (strain PCC 8106) TaxID=313612 RepID=UPI0000EAB677|nr:hypothetical protein [Lyngbya sp. PCC 8106]EAW36017.1 hypothetical protein L8106_22516 [Lyngbya sp. PCC 8106]
MAVKKSKGLGSNPLDRGIFSKTDSQEEPPEVELKSQESGVEIQQSKVKSQESRKQKDSESSQESTVNTQESRVKSVESRFLNREQAELKGTNVRLPIELIDWVDDLVKQGSRDKNKSRIPKEVWFQAALELFQAMPVDWDDISDEDELKDKLKSLESIIKNL